MCKSKWIVWIILMCLCARLVEAKSPTNKPQLYLVGYSHLDTQWLWTYPTTINEYLPDTLNQNFALFENYPDYLFNFSGANRYRMIHEYYPEDFVTMKDYIAKGRWFPCGNSWEESDVNVPSPESLIRQVLYGHHYFKKEFGTESAEYMLPDCFGFPASLPSILAHCGVKGFSTQKLTWGSAVGIPFDIGLWVGPDSNSVIAAFNPGKYTGELTSDLSRDESWLERCNDLGKLSGFYGAYHYYGVGDRGGAPTEDSVKWMETSVKGSGPISVRSTKADQLFLDITEEQRSKFPTYSGDLLLTEHSAGSITSQGYMKRWNRKNELLADAAEKASVAAALISASSYPQETFNQAWGLVLGAQFHDILPGTSIPEAYTFSQNDEVIALNLFASTLTKSLTDLCCQLDTQVDGIPLVVFNPLSIEREDPVEALLAISNAVNITVLDATGQPVPTQILERKKGETKILFTARVPSVGLAVFSVVTNDVAAVAATNLTVSHRMLENDRYRVKINADGNIASILDKALNEELLAAPARLALTYEKPKQWPAWNMDWKDRQLPPKEYVTKPVDTKIIEKGPVRVALEIRREVDNSTVVQTVRLSNGSAGERIEIDCLVDWMAEERALRAEFPLTVANPLATYNWGLGKIERGNNDELKYEVPTHGWMDLMHPKKQYGVSIFTDAKYGTDKPDDNTLRLTLLYTPGVHTKHVQQSSQDWGRHEFIYGLAGHTGDWRSSKADWTAMRMNQPMPVFQSTKHSGQLGRSFSLIQTSSDQIAVQAVKRAEDHEGIVLRVQELHGKPARNVTLQMTPGILSATEINGVETALHEVQVADDKLQLDFTPYQLRSFSLTMNPPTHPQVAAPSQAIVLPYDCDGFSYNRELTDSRAGFDNEGRSIPAEMISNTVTASGVTFQIGPREKDQLNVITCRGQTLPLPSGDWNRVYLLAASAGEDTLGTFSMGSTTTPLRIQSWNGFIGQWDTRIFKEDTVTAITPGFIKRDPLAWFCSHRHLEKGQDDAYAFSYLFIYSLELPAGTTSLTLPKNDKIRIVALSVAQDNVDRITPVTPLYDDFSDRKELKLNVPKKSSKK